MVLYKFSNNMTYNFRAEFDNFPKSWKIYGIPINDIYLHQQDGLSYPNSQHSSTNLFDDTQLIAEHTCTSRQLDSDGFINEGPFYYNKLPDTLVSIYTIHICIT